MSAVGLWRLACLVAGVLVLGACSSGGKPQNPDVPAAASIRLTSSAFAAGSSIPSRFTCDGDDVSPDLSWSGGPVAEEYVLIVTDLDAGFIHWVAFALPGAATGIPEGSLPPAAKEGTNDFGKRGYRGPCPPSGSGPHRYRFVLYALAEPTKDAIREGASGDEVLDAIRCCVAARGILTGTYSR
ncbi:MAG TPA: YbhB/YbcL family Raf kinase inhibitor-like protein [Actinomycetota bacterium]|nr:YbhB/YbcL family Raf kinase inhibitor-like protein [Actinomycetota bacterium]